VLTAFAICFMAKFVPPFAAMGLLVALVEASVPLALASVVACGYPPAVELAGVTSLLRPRHLPRARTDPGELSSPLRDPRLDGHGEDRWRSLAGVLPPRCDCVLPDTRVGALPSRCGRTIGNRNIPFAHAVTDGRLSGPISVASWCSRRSSCVPDASRLRASGHHCCALWSSATRHQQCGIRQRGTTSPSASSTRLVARASQRYDGG
jgi:hypothetical protein